MNKQLKGILAAVAPVVCLGILGGSAKAATLSIFLSEDAGPITPVVGGSATTVGAWTHQQVVQSVTFGDFDVTFFGAASDDGVSLSDLLSATTSVKNSNHVSAGTHTLKLYAVETDYDLPVGPQLILESQAGGSVVAANTLGATGLFEGFFDNTDSVNPFVAGDTFGPQDAIFAVGGKSFDTGTSDKGVTRTTPNFSLGSVTTFSLSGGAQGNFSSNLSVAAPLPSVAWVGMGLMGALFVARRRAQA